MRSYVNNADEQRKIGSHSLFRLTRKRLRFGVLVIFCFFLSLTVKFDLVKISFTTVDRNVLQSEKLSRLHLVRKFWNFLRKNVHVYMHYCNAPCVLVFGASF